MERIRPASRGSQTLMFELHERRLSPGFLAEVDRQRGPFLDAYRTGPERARPPGWSLRKPEITYAPPAALVPRPGASIPKRTSGTSVSEEWRTLGFNCGGATLAWVGVVGAGAAAPVTGGASLGASIWLYTGAAAASVQCAASVYRVWNIKRSKTHLNDQLDHWPAYKWTMRGLDVVGLAGAAGAIKEARAADRAIRVAGSRWSEAIQRTASAGQRRQIAGAMGLQAGTIGSKVLSRISRQKLLDGAGGVLGIVSSVDGGVVRELIVWVTTEDKAR